MLDSGSKKLDEILKQLLSIRESKVKLQARLLKAEASKAETTHGSKSYSDEGSSGPSSTRAKKQ